MTTQVKTKTRILLAEDSPSERRILREILEGGFSDELAVFENGLELYFSVLEEGADLILASLHLPGMDGLTLCQLLKRRRAFTAVPIYCMCALADRALMARAKEAGAEDLLETPVEPEALLERVQAAMAKNVWLQPA